MFLRQFQFFISSDNMIRSVHGMISLQLVSKVMSDN